jgi:dipeptidyl aminopeptidase/acylaminoacyl peptidase
LDEDTVEQLTEIRAAGSPPLPSTVKGTESQEYLKKEERGLLGIVEERAKRREEREAQRKKENPREPWTLPARHTVQQMMLSPDGGAVIATIVEAGEKNKRTIVPNYVTESAYAEDIPARDKVGDAPGASKLAVFDRVTGKQRWVDFKANLSMPTCNEAGSHCVLRARSADNKDVWLLALDWKEAKVRELAKVHDDAWVRVPGFGLTSGWLADGRYFYLSEQSGYAHVYTISPNGGEAKQLTSGSWEVREVRLSDDKRVFYLASAEAGAAETQVYAMSIDGGTRKRITTQPGEHNVTVAPDGSLADVYGYANKPPELFVNGKQATQSPATDFASYPWIDPPIVEIPARDGVKVPARMYKPANFKKGGPLVVFVHGAGYLQNAHKFWSSYAREYMFHHLLMDRGYTVLDVDYRGSAGYGRDWRTAVYRHMGGKDLDDQVDAVKWAVANHGVDPKRVGLYGGSYGGFITLMALFTQPDVFAAGAALRPVTDWAHYNQGYTSNILNLPQKDQEAYKRSSPIYHAAGLKGALLICHGMVDVNVHYQDSVRLVQKLIELRKENWEFASYPVEDHGFVQPTSWADEYKRILKLFETNLAEPKAPSSTSRR